MIYRKWSLLTGPTSIVAVAVAGAVVASLIFGQNDPSVKPKPRNSEAMASSK